MPDNVLQSIGLSPEWFSQVMGTVANGTPSPDQSGAPAQPPQMPMSAQEAGVPASPQDPGMPAAATPPMVPQDPAAPVNAMQGVNPAPVQPQAPQAAPPPQRHSLLDTIGKIANAFAVGGHATPQYGPQGYWQRDQVDRANALADHAQAAELNTQKIASNQMDNLSQQGKQIQGAAAQLQAIVKANPQIDPGKAWGLLSQRFGLDPQKAAQIFSDIQADPNALTALASGADDGGKEKYSGNLTYVKNPTTGEVRVLQAGLASNDARNILPQGFVPIAAPGGVKVVDAGDHNILYDNNGNSLGTVAKTVTPDAAARNSTEIQIAGMPARPQAPKPGAPKTDPYTGFSTSVRGLQSLDKSLNDLVTNPNLPGATGLVAGRLNVTSGQRAIQGQIDSLEGQAIPAAIAAIKASGGASPRAVSEITGEAKGLIGAIRNRNMDPEDYIANVNAARGRLRDRISDLTNDAVRQGFAVRGSDGTIHPAAQAPAAPTAALPPRIQGTLHPAAPANGGWSIVGVH